MDILEARVKSLGSSCGQDGLKEADASVCASCLTLNDLCSTRLRSCLNRGLQVFASVRGCPTRVVLRSHL